MASCISTALQFLKVTTSGPRHLRIVLHCQVAKQPCELWGTGQVHDVILHGLSPGPFALCDTRWVKTEAACLLLPGLPAPLGESTALSTQQSLIRTYHIPRSHKEVLLLPNHLGKDDSSNPKADIQKKRGD